MDMVKFRSYSLFRDYAKAYEADDTKAKSRINDELDASYSRWRKGRKDVFDCRDGEGAASMYGICSVSSKRKS